MVVSERGVRGSSPDYWIPDQALHFPEFLFLLILFCLGEYTIDPNEGCSSDAVEVYCDFEKQATCVNPQKTKVKLVYSKPFAENVSFAHNLKWNVRVLSQVVNGFIIKLLSSS